MKRRDTGSLALYLCVLISPTQSLLISTDPPEKEAVLSSATQPCISSPRRLNCLQEQLLHLLSRPPRQWEQLLTQKLLLGFNISKQLCIFTHLTNVFSWILTAVMLAIYICVYISYLKSAELSESCLHHTMLHIPNLDKIEMCREIINSEGCNTDGLAYRVKAEIFIFEWYLLSESKINSTGERQMCAEGFRSKWTARCPPLLRGVLFLGGWGKDSAGCPDKAVPTPLPQDQRGRGAWGNTITVNGESSTHMTEQLLVFSFLKVEESKSDLLGRWRSLLERRRVGLFFGRACSLFMQAIAAVRKTLWMLFSEVNAEHSR